MRRCAVGMKPFFLALIALAGGACTSNGRYALLQRAEEYSRREKFDDAVTAYREHIKIRLNIKERPTWENPYFYLLLIGDLQLQQKQFEAALASFELAEKNGVDRRLVSDRYVFVASLYEKEGKLDDAISILRRYRERDPLFYDMVLDRLAKELTRREDQAAAAPPSPGAGPRPPP
jgi:tetratricopeptide (TPR) repeat protein